MTVRGDTEDARPTPQEDIDAVREYIKFPHAYEGYDAWQALSRVSVDLLRLQVSDQGEDSGGSEAVSSGGSRLLYVSHDLSLSERRAVFVYEGARLQALAVDAPIVPELWPEREAPFRDQFVAYVDGLCNAEEFPTPEDAHDSWWRAYEEMGWVYGEVRDTELKTHPDMVPFSELEQREQDKDAVFLALVAIARDWIRA